MKFTALNKHHSQTFINQQVVAAKCMRLKTPLSLILANVSLAVLKSLQLKSNLSSSISHLLSYVHPFEHKQILCQLDVLTTRSVELFCEQMIG